MPNAVCGPQVNNTAVAPPGTDLTLLNECPLNACCDIWGQCGTTTEFCTPSTSTTGAPGTAAAGQNGCISNCGTQISVSASPSKIFSIAYFEGFDWQRPCLTMSVEAIDTTAYTHIHFAFATLNADFSINTTSVSSQLQLLQGMTGIKRIISIGGWSFSTDPATYMIFRNAVSSEANRQTLIKNVVAFLNNYGMHKTLFHSTHLDSGKPRSYACGAVSLISLALDHICSFSAHKQNIKTHTNAIIGLDGVD